MKIFKHIFAFMALGLAFVACQIEGKDAFSKAPVAPVLDEHSDILVTEATAAESLTFSWSAARFIDTESYLYNLYVAFGEKEAVLAENLSTTYYLSTKEDFRMFMKDNFEFEQNSTQNISLYVTIADKDGKIYKSDALFLNVYLYDTVPAVLESALTEIVLDKETPAEEIALLSWSGARLVYGEDVTYSVYIKVGEGEEKELASSLTSTSWTTTVDGLNEAVVAAGGVEEAASDAVFYVKAFCESIPVGVASNEVTVNVTTYIATFPETMYFPGSHQGWAPAVAPTLTASKTVKGLYQGFVELTTKDGADVEFKISPNPAWEGDFGFSDVNVKTENTTIDEAETSYSYVSASTVSKDNIKCPSGFYFVKLDKKFNTLEMVQVLNLEIIGSFTSSWAAPLAMTWDETAKTWASPEITVAELESGSHEFKFRFNSAWSYSFGGSLDKVEFGTNPANIVFGNPASIYKFVLNASTSDFSVNAVDVNMPPYLVIAGDYSEHSWSGTNDMRVYLKDAEKGIYKGYFSMYNGTHGFKFVKNGSVWMGLSSNEGLVYSLTEDGSAGNCMIEEGSYYWEVDIMNLKATATPLTSVGMMGSFEASAWGSDLVMTFDEKSLTYSAEVEFAEGDEFKFRFNGSWDYNLGAGDEGLVQDGGNLKVGKAGIYTVTLDMAHGSYPAYTIVAK